MIGFHADIKSYFGYKQPNYSIEFVAVPNLTCPLDCIKIKQINIVVFLLCLPCSVMSPKTCIDHHQNIFICDDGNISLDHTIHMIKRHVLHEHGKKHFLST